LKAAMGQAGFIVPAPSAPDAFFGQQAADILSAR